MPFYKSVAIVILGISITSGALAFEFTNEECEYKVNFPFRPSIKTLVNPLSNGMYSNRYMAMADDATSGRAFIANCDTSLRLVPEASMSEKRKMVEWSMRQWGNIVNLKPIFLYWEQHGEYETLKVFGQRVIVVAGEQFNISFQARVYLGQRSTMMVGVGERSFLSPSLEMRDFLNNSISMSD